MSTPGLRWLSIALTVVVGLGLGLGLGACEGNGPGGETESNCADGIDNDSDGLTDCDDPDCATSTACPVCDHDGICDADEDAVGCPDDCGTPCGDGTCEGGETRVTCPQDCAVCDDGFCDTGEDRANCPEDCAVCNDGHCDPGEDRVTCPDDCAACGDAICDSNEDRITCPGDCILCGDTFCDTGETIANCPVDCATVLIDEDFATFVPTGWVAPEWLQITQGTTTWAQCTNDCIAQDAVLQSLTFSTVGFANVWVSFTQDYQFAGTGVMAGLYLDAPPDYYTIAQPTDLPVGTVVYDISAEAANRAAVQLHIAVTCINTSECFLNDHWRVTDVLVWAW